MPYKTGMTNLKLLYATRGLYKAKEGIAFLKEWHQFFTLATETLISKTQWEGKQPQKPHTLQHYLVEGVNYEDFKISKAIALSNSPDSLSVTSILQSLAVYAAKQ